MFMCLCSKLYYSMLVLVDFLMVHTWLSDWTSFHIKKIIFYFIDIKHNQKHCLNRNEELLESIDWFLS